VPNLEETRKIPIERMKLFIPAWFLMLLLMLSWNLTLVESVSAQETKKITYQRTLDLCVVNPRNPDTDQDGLKDSVDTASLDPQRGGPGVLEKVLGKVELVHLIGLIVIALPILAVIAIAWRIALGRRALRVLGYRVSY
jgi:hypothetical protein